MKKNILVKFLYRLEALWRVISSKDLVVIAIKRSGKEVITLGITNDKDIDAFIDEIPINKLLVTKKGTE